MKTIVFLAFFVCSFSSAFAADPTYIEVEGPDKIKVRCPSQGGRVKIMDEVGNVKSVFKCPDPVKDTGGTISLSDVFRIGLRLQLGGMGGFARTNDVGDGAAISLLGSLVFQVPSLFGDLGGLEFSAGSGIAGFPGMADMLSANVFEAAWMLKLTDDININLGYRFLSMVDLDESIALAHYGRAGMQFKLGRQTSIGFDLYAGGSTVSRRERWTVEDDIGIRTYEGVVQVSDFSFWGEFNFTYWFW